MEYGLRTVLTYLLRENDNLIIFTCTLEYRKQLDDEQTVVNINEGKSFIIQSSKTHR